MILEENRAPNREDIISDTSVSQCARDLGDSPVPPINADLVQNPISRASTGSTPSTSSNEADSHTGSHGEGRTDSHTESHEEGRTEVDSSLCSQSQRAPMQLPSDEDTGAQNSNGGNTATIPHDNGSNSSEQTPLLGKKRAKCSSRK